MHQRPTAKDDENADRMETESRYFEPDQSQNGQRSSRKIAPVGGRKNAVFEVGPEKVKVCDK
jgi:hypothetical protein